MASETQPPAQVQPTQAHEPGTGGTPPGESAADGFAELYARYAARALRAAAGLTRDPLAAEDVVAEVFGNLWRRWTPGTEWPWAYVATAVRNEWYDRCRRLRRERGLPPASVVPQAAPDDLVADRELVRQLLAELPHAERQTLTLRYLHDLSEASTAARLGRSTSSVKSLAWRGRTRLRSTTHAAVA